MKKYIKYLIALTVTLSLTSCLKDDDLIGPDAPGAINNIIEFGNISAPSSSINSTYPLYVYSFDVSNSVDLVIPVKIVGVYNPQSDVKVVLEVDNSIISSYNDEQEANYEALQSANYTVPSLEVTIPKGQKSANFVLKILADKLDFDATYALGLKIKSVSEGVISGNFGNIIVATIPKNFFDGVYQYTTSANTSLVPNANKTVKLVTVGSNKASLDPGLLGTYSNEVVYTIDPQTNQITVTCPSLGVQTPQDTRSMYDPATKTLKVYWKQGNGGRTFEETFVYTGPR